MALDILLVEDEYLVLKGMEIMLREQKEVDITLTTAMDAVEAMHKLSDCHPDVIITDINMPEIDGLTMLERTYSAHPFCKFVIISGYETHEYLKRSLSLHVDDYLTKPIDKAYLIRRLVEFNMEKENRMEHTLLKIKLLLFRGETVSETAFTAKELSTLFPCFHFALCAVAVTEKQAEELKKRISSYFEEVYLFHQTTWSIFLLNYSARISPEKLTDILKELITQASFGLSSFHGLSDRFSQNIVHSCQKALAHMVLSGLPVAANNAADTADRIASHTLTPAIRFITLDIDIWDYINTVFDASLKPADNFLLIFTETLTAYTLVAGFYPPESIILQLYQSWSNNVNGKQELSKFLEKELSFWYDSSASPVRSNYSSKINDACQYISSNYAKDISLENVADFLSVNPSYLSYIFKKETGITFVQYLTNIRMEKACSLMTEHPNLTLDAISAQTGYHSASYFHKIFQSRFGVSPRQWLASKNRKG